MALPAEKCDASPAGQWEESDAWPVWDALPAGKWEESDDWTVWDALPTGPCEKSDALPVWDALPAGQWEWEVCKACIYDTSAGMLLCPSCMLSCQIYIEQREAQLEGVHLRNFAGGLRWFAGGLQWFARGLRILKHLRIVGWWQRF